VGGEVHFWSARLGVNKTTGKKFGKSEDGAVWLDENKTSVYKFYQFWLNVDDSSAADFLKFYTLLSKEEIERVLYEFESNRSGRVAQKTLAYEVTKLAHGPERAESVKRASEVLFGSAGYDTLQVDDFDVFRKELPAVSIQPNDELIAVLVSAGLASSNSEARRFLEQGAVSLNGAPVSADVKITPDDLLQGSYGLLRRGKNAYAFLQIAE
jgi:tyrosyl-tRNA synthetase